LKPIALKSNKAPYLMSRARKGITKFEIQLRPKAPKSKAYTRGILIEIGRLGVPPTISEAFLFDVLLPLFSKITVRGGALKVFIKESGTFFFLRV
jgi:hypothetical protein